MTVNNYVEWVRLWHSATRQSRAKSLWIQSRYTMYFSNFKYVGPGDSPGPVARRGIFSYVVASVQEPCKTAVDPDPWGEGGALVPKLLPRVHAQSLTRGIVADAERCEVGMAPQICSSFTQVAGFTTDTGTSASSGGLRPPGPG